jgi:hypothetical protein
VVIKSIWTGSIFANGYLQLLTSTKKIEKKPEYLKKAIHGKIEIVSGLV